MKDIISCNEKTLSSNTLHSYSETVLSELILKNFHNFKKSYNFVGYIRLL